VAARNFELESWNDLEQIDANAEDRNRSSALYERDTRIGPSGFPTPAATALASASGPTG